jgi:hypothetical protein
MEHEQDREALLRRYIELKEKAKQLEAEIESLKSNLFFTISQIQDEIRETEVVFEDYVFTISYRKSYDYPPHIKKMEEKLKSLKKEAEASGEAILKSESGYVMLKKRKN